MQNLPCKLFVVSLWVWILKSMISITYWFNINTNHHRSQHTRITNKSYISNNGFPPTRAGHTNLSCHASKESMGTGIHLSRFLPAAQSSVIQPRRTVQISRKRQGSIATLLQRCPTKHSFSKWCSEADFIRSQVRQHLDWRQRRDLPWHLGRGGVVDRSASVLWKQTRNTWRGTAWFQRMGHTCGSFSTHHQA